MDHQSHSLGVGAIVTNLQALETVLRCFLMQKDGTPITFPKLGDTSAPETWLTRFVSLGGLISNYNSALSETEKPTKAIDLSVVEIRDAFAHGRLFVYGDSFPGTLWKFGRGKRGQVPVEFCEKLTDEWLTGKRNFIDAQRTRVVECFKARGYRGLN